MPRPHRGGGLTIAPGSISRPVAFWLLATLLVLFLFAASAPSPLYAAYQSAFGFAPVTLTAIYAVYALGALSALLVTGRLSDHVGRRIVVSVALTVELVAMAAFIAASGVELLFVARLLQGAATGMASGAISAWLLDLEPLDHPRLAAVIGGAALMAGLGLGALVAGVLVDAAPDPFHLVYWTLLVLFAVALVLMPLLPDPAPRAPEWVRSMRPEVGVPTAARSLFVASMPSLVATWAVAGLYLALGPSLATLLLHSNRHAPGGLVIAALLGTSAISSLAVRNVPPRRLVVNGSILLGAGVALTVVAVRLDSVIGLYVASVIAGVGFGPAFAGIFRSLVSLAPAAKRGALVAAIYIAIYVAFSIPTVAAGLGVGVIGLPHTTYVYGFLAAMLALVTAAAVGRPAEVAAPSG
jgi:hypothetical protein